MQLGGIHTRTIRNEEDGTFSIDTLNNLLRDGSPWSLQHLVCVENTHCLKGGRTVPRQWLMKVSMKL